MKKIPKLFLTSLLLFFYLKSQSQETYSDTFQNVSFSNNYGSMNFTTDWFETGTEGPNNPWWGKIMFESNKLRFTNLDNNVITRTLDLSDAFSVELTLDYNRVSGNESIAVQLFDGSNYTTVGTLAGSGTFSYTLNSNQISANSGIRFRSASNGWSNWEKVDIDNVLFTAVIENDPPVVIGYGSQVYCAGSTIPVATSINITDPDDTATSAVYIQISNGYINSEDILTLTGSHPNITSSWNATEGELTLLGPAAHAEFMTAILATEYSSSSINPSGTRQFSITAGEPNFLPATQHYYEFIPALNITWENALIAAGNRSYFGLQGYLVTLTSQVESDFSGSQAQGVGWIGASDKAVEGEWRWMAGPEVGIQFWSGAAGGTELTFAFWNSGEPNNAGGEDYAHITDPAVTSSPGSWNDLPNTTSTGGNYQAKGYIVEYGGMPGDPVLQITALTTIEISSCEVLTNKRITYRVNRD